MDEGKESWLVENDDGSISISFDGLGKKPVIDGTEVGELLMREPTVNDQLAVQRQHSDPAAGEVALIANLAEIAPEAVSGMTLRQYNRCRAALAVFTG